MNDECYEFVNIDERDTGINNIIIHIFSIGDKKLKNFPRIKISNKYDEFDKTNSFTIDVKNKKVIDGKVKIKENEFQNVLKWVKLNEKKLIKYWKFGNEIITEPFLDSLKQI